MDIKSCTSRAALVQWWNRAGAGEQNILVALLLGWKRIPANENAASLWEDPQGKIHSGVPHYVNSWHHAGPLLEEMGPGWELSKDIYTENWIAYEMRASASIAQPTPTRAICLAYVVKRWEEGRK